MPGEIPLEWTTYGYWRNQYAFSDNDFVRGLDESLAGHVGSVVKKPYRSLRDCELRFCVPSAKRCLFIERWVRFATLVH